MQHYLATVKFVSQEEGKNGKIKYSTNTDKYLVNSNSIPNVYKVLNKVLEGVYDSFTISGVTESKIIGYIDETKDIIGNN